MSEGDGVKRMLYGDGETGGRCRTTEDRVRLASLLNGFCIKSQANFFPFSQNFDWVQ